MLEPLQMWGGVECTLNRVGDRYFDQLALSGHLDRVEQDMARFAGMGLRTLRTCLHWERFVAEEQAGRNPWLAFDRTLHAMRANGMEPIVGFVHHGSGPPDTSLVDPEFPEKLAVYALRVAERYPWVQAYTPVNEPNTTARFACLYSHWYPHLRNMTSFVRAMLVQVKGVALSMSAIRSVQPHARLITTEDGGRITSTAPLAAEQQFREQRRWLGTDLLCGAVTPAHPLHAWLLANGATADELAWFVANPSRPDVIGLNYYLTSDRLLDHRTENYPSEWAGGDLGQDAFIDIEALRVCPVGLGGSKGILLDAWHRYHIPTAITECHIGSSPEDQQRWLAWMWQGALDARAAGADVRAVTAWALLGSYNWHCLCTQHTGTYEPGVFTLADGKEPVPTPLATTVQQLARGQSPACVTGETPWWLHDDRLTFPVP